jgi:hypothetical protein
MKKLLVICCLISSCAVAQKPVKISQGVQGTVVERKGNYMPSPGAAPDNGKPLVTDVLVYELTNRNEVSSADGTTFTNLTKKLIAKTSTDNNGFYMISLPVGIYSVFINNGHLYANSIDGKGNINPVTITKNNVAQLNIMVSNTAVY